MIIAIDGNEANLKNRVGVNMFAFGVLWGLYNLARSTIRGSRRIGNLGGVTPFMVFLSENPRADLPPETKWWKYEVFGPKPLWTWVGLVKRLYLGKPRPDVFFTPSHYGPGFCSIPYVISIMDLGFLRYPRQFTKKDFWQLKNWTAWSARKASKIIAISQFTKDNIIKTYGLGKDRVVVAYPGYKKTNSPVGEKKLKAIKKKYGIRGKYLLCLGTLKPSKNIIGLVEAYRILLKKNPDLKINLVIAGKKGWLYEEIFNKVNQLGLGNRVIFTGFIEDREMPALMKGSQVFCIPSFWEGFGMPALEAMSLGVPAVAGKAGSLPEIVGKAGVLVDPYQPKKIAEGIEKVLENQGLRARIIKKGKQRIGMFNWANCSKIIYQTLIEVAKQ